LPHSGDENKKDMTKKSQELLKEINELRAERFQKTEKDKEELAKEITSERRAELWKEYKEETEKFEKEVKTRILSDLSSWALDPQGFFYRVDGRLKNINEKAGTAGKHTSYSTIHFYNYNENYRDEIVNAFIEEIKQNPQDWKIRRVEPGEKVMINGHDFDYGTHSAVEHKSGRKHYKPDFNQIGSFSSTEWAEIENALNQKTDNKELVEKKNELQIKEDKNKKMIAEWEGKDQQSEKGEDKITTNQQNSLQKSDNKENNQNIYYGVGLISLVLLLIGLLVVGIKKKR